MAITYISRTLQHDHTLNIIYCAVVQRGLYKDNEQNRRLNRVGKEYKKMKFIKGGIPVNKKARKIEEVAPITTDN